MHILPYMSDAWDLFADIDAITHSWYVILLIIVAAMNMHSLVYSM